MQTDLHFNAKRILIIDDDPDLLDILTEYFNMEGLEVKTTPSGSDMFQLIKIYKPDLLILDYILNGINGGELCHQVKTSAQTNHIPVAIISAYPRVLLSLGTYGCDLFIPKPFDLQKLTLQIKQLLLKTSNIPVSYSYHLHT